MEILKGLIFQGYFGPHNCILGSLGIGLAVQSFRAGNASLNLIGGCLCCSFKLKNSGCEQKMCLQQRL